MSPDGMRIAAFSNGALVIIDATTRREIERVQLPRRDSAPQGIVGSPDGKRLLIGLYGENGGAGDPQSDYFLVNPATRKWTPQLTARRSLWLRGGMVLYLRPYVCGSAGGGKAPHVWTSQLATYNLALHKNTALTSGLVLNDSLATCGH